MGRFTQEDDRYDDGMNLYAYCRNNPVKYTDPSGHGTTSGPDRDSQADFYVSPDGTVVPGDTIYVTPDGTAIPGSQFNPDANNPNPNGSNTQSQGTNQSSLFDLVDEMNQTGGCDSTDQSIIHDWADEYGVDYDSLGVNAKSESGIKTVNGYDAKVNVGQQNKHIHGTNEYKNALNNGQTKSILYGDTNDIQNLLNQKAGTGDFLGTNKERVNF